MVGQSYILGRLPWQLWRRERLPLAGKSCGNRGSVVKFQVASWSPIKLQRNPLQVGNRLKTKSPYHISPKWRHLQVFIWKNRDNDGLEGVCHCLYICSGTDKLRTWVANSRLLAPFDWHFGKYVIGGKRLNRQNLQICGNTYDEEVRALQVRDGRETSRRKLWLVTVSVVVDSWEIEWSVTTSPAQIRTHIVLLVTPVSRAPSLGAHPH